MLKIGCKDSYNVLHINNEIGQYVIGGAGTYMNEMYRYRDSNEGFVHITSDGADIDTEYYPGREEVEKEIAKAIKGVQLYEITVEHLTGKQIQEK